MTQTLVQADTKPSNRQAKIVFGIKSVVLLLAVLAAAKVLVFFSIYLASGSPNSFMQELGTKWDSGFFDKIAQLGYAGASQSGGNDAYAFSPVLPSMIALVRDLTGSYWSAGLLLVNIFSFLFPIVVFKLFDFRTALIAELFPIYIVFSTLNYADVITLLFLALALLFLFREKYLLTGIALGTAVSASYTMILTLPAFILYLFFREKQRNKDYFSAIRTSARALLPVSVAGFIIATFFLVNTGSLWTFFTVEETQGWGVGWVTPIVQAQFLLGGWFTGIQWTVMGVYLPTFYWLARNLAFEAFYFGGVVLLLKRGGTTDRLGKWFLALLSLSIISPLLFLDGVAAASIPRLFLPAFPVFLGYSRNVFKGNRSLAIYSLASIALAVVVGLVQLDAFFS